MEDEEDEGIEKDKKAETKRKRIQKSKSPERPDQSGDLAFKPEKSIWESPFLTADRGVDSAYPSSHASDQSRTSDESDDLSQKMVASLSVSIDEDVVDSQLNSPNNNDTSVLLDSGNQKTIDLASVRLERTLQGSESSEDSNSTASKGSQGKRKKDGGLVTKLWNPAKKDRPFDSGQVSPVYFEESGESSSDFAMTSPSTGHSTTFTFSSSAREECIGEEEETPRVTAEVTGQVNKNHVFEQKFILTCKINLKNCEVHMAVKLNKNTRCFSVIRIRAINSSRRAIVANTYFETLILSLYQV